VCDEKKAVIVVDDALLITTSLLMFSPQMHNGCWMRLLPRHQDVWVPSRAPSLQTAWYHYPKRRLHPLSNTHSLLFHVNLLAAVYN